MLKNKKILLKISGEFLGNPPEFKAMNKVIEFINKLISFDSKVCIVVGGGNIIRGRNASQNRVIYDQMGMIATVINALAIQAKIPQSKCFSSIEISGICPQYSFLDAISHFNQNNVVIFAGGIGNSHCSTDVCAVIRAIEMECDMILKMTNVNGIFDKDPHIFSEAKFLNHITYHDAICKNLHVMDMAALSIASNHNMPVIIFSLDNVDDEFFNGNGIFSLLTNEKDSCDKR